MTIGLNTTPRGATTILDANKVILDEDPIPGVLPTLVHPGDILAGQIHPDPIGGADLILRINNLPSKLSNVEPIIKARQL